MSIIPIRSSLSKPELRLAHAVSEFEAALSKEQKTIFRAYKFQSISCPPTPSDVMRLTAEIDRQISARSRRCFGPRLTNFLQAVQQFAALGDVIVGGSQNIIACSVWSLVRMSLLSIVNFSSYLEKLSTLLMIVGRSAPRYQAMASFYPQSENIKSHLSEYFIVVVRLCHQLLKFTQKSAIGQFASTINDSDIKTYQSELELWANMIKEEASMLTVKKIGEESHENFRFRDVFMKHSESMSLRRKMKVHRQILDLCSTYDYETAWKQTRKVGNAALFNQNAEYRDWKFRADSCTLVYTGKLGSGKSVLLANIVDDINLHVQSENVAVSYFFCRHDIPESLKARTIFGSLARQLLRSIANLASQAEILNETPSPQDLKPISGLLLRALPSGFKAYFILDGLDECEHAEREMLVRQLRKLQKKFMLILCVSIGLNPENTLMLSTEKFRNAIITSIPEKNSDIEGFIDAELASCIEAEGPKRLTVGDPRLILEIRDALLEGSQGMFLWVALQIESLCSMQTDDAIRQALANLPKNLSETFSRILRRSQGPALSYQRRILELITATRRPLTTEELREALSVVPGNTIWNPSRLLNNVYSTLTCCGSLLIVDEEELTVRFVHHSVKKFLLKDFKDLTSTPFTLDSANRNMADTIITYLNYGVFGTQISTAAVPEIMSGSVPSKIIHSTQDSSSNARRVALKLLKSRKRPNFDIGKVLAQMRPNFNAGAESGFYFFSYAKSYWLQHILSSSEQDADMYSLLFRLFKENIVDINATDNNGWTPLHWAAHSGHEAVVKVMLDSGKIDVNLKDKSGQTPLCLATWNRHEATVKLFLESEFDMTLENSNGLPLLTWAIQNGHETIVKLLLNSGKVDINLKDTSGLTPLWWAILNEHEPIINLLLEFRVDANERDKYGQTPLTWAAQNGDEAIVKLLLLASGVDADSKDPDGWTPLHWAAQNGHVAVVRLLLDSKRVDANLQGIDGWTPLIWAVQNGYEAIVKLLLDFGVDANLKDRQGRTPLWWAAQAGYKDVIRLLLNHEKVDANLQNIIGWTPLQWAVQKGHESIVKLLLDSGKVDVDLPNNIGYTPLQLAALQGHEAVIKLLLEFRADTDLMDKHGRTPLQLATEKGNKAIAKLLREFGADAGEVVC